MLNHWRIALLTLASAGTANADANPILDPAPYTKWVATSTDGLSRKALVTVPFVNSSGANDSVNLWRADLVGNAQQRGFAQGELYAVEIWELLNVGLPKFFFEMADLGLDISSLPQWLQDVIRAELDVHSVKGFYRALQWVWEKEKDFVPTRLLNEINAMGDGICAGLAKVNQSKFLGEDKTCDSADWVVRLQQVNMLPELIKMTCTMFGAWGQASASSKLIQLRALDFGSSPLANYSLLAIHRPVDASAATSPSTESDGLIGNDEGDLWQGFAALGFPGLVGVVTGVSQRGIGLSEKVWETYNDTTGVQEGHYDGEVFAQIYPPPQTSAQLNISMFIFDADVLVMRDVLEMAPNRTSAEAHMRADPTRTFAVFLGVGDYDTQRMDIVGYRESDFHAYTDETMPAVTGQPYMKDLVYVDKHPQPSADPTTLPDLLNASYGNLDAVTTISIAAGHETGDLHIAIYDYNPEAPKLWVSLGRIDQNGDFGPDNAWKACFRPYLAYTMADLWAGV